MQFLKTEKLTESLGVAPEDSNTITENVAELLSEKVLEIKDILSSLADELKDAAINQVDENTYLDTMAFHIHRVYNPTITPKLYYIVREFVKDENTAWCLAGYFYAESRDYLIKQVKAHSLEIVLSEIK